MSMGWDYPPGAELDPRAPWNQDEPETDTGHERDDTRYHAHKDDEGTGDV